MQLYNFIKFALKIDVGWKYSECTARRKLRLWKTTLPLRCSCTSKELQSAAMCIFSLLPDAVAKGNLSYTGTGGKWHI